ncbi:PDDEXK family nuclease [Couchioplanes caeruleus]|uniref:DUF91 domain-containing protein n=2 Tax=Couchioplanes caeruleus TaxID=56438 RepID=A0A1K0GIJ4_9ACTN|nr:hypothetical protein [Couchioplanes caeruleus]OJF10748.1 hypothetical protein BG844_30260 [Couchioplanes caeruleus subsp. caeruleus]ROP28152.1 hypothetical protein EDD30_0862 [Couchioplanes caeruleus]
MTTDGVFWQADGHLVLMEQAPYDTESVLQQLLASYPEVIAGPTTEDDDEPRLLLVRREVPVPSAGGGGRTWSLDHLFIDAQGVLVLVEVKRSSDTRIRREYVGQMLDYAANAVRYWPLADLRHWLQQRAEERSSEMGELLTEENLLSELRPDVDPDEFWKAVETNLSAGRIRMLFVADELPDELVRIIEFLNEQMNPAEVLGVEVRKHIGDEHTVYVRTVRGRTTAAVTVKTRELGPRWERESFLDTASKRCPDAEVALMRRLLDDVDQRGGQVCGGRGAKMPNVNGRYPLAGKLSPVWQLSTSSDRPGTNAWLRFRLDGIVRRLGAARVDRAAKALETIPALAPRIAAAREKEWRAWPPLYLNEVVSSEHHTQSVFDAIGDLVADN